ncbi:MULTISPECIES: hypothetical protein [unclassified Francisella]|uniref:hypothetical protein n=1 Tax=unclassified Francisella TaxID=2610885 RepID=UPI002E301681|nr:MULTISPECIES: hypothetical protein [unclassified Francisella]MED7819904.1 hypothetical protein [Francisella sp. 19S2-4]MED7830720.1 hypothetical protein [Francisella sp. 19S2-10]
MQKIAKYLLTMLVIISLVACSKEDSGASQNVILTGDYAKTGFEQGIYQLEKATLDLSGTQAKITCPKGYVIPSLIKTPDFGAKLPQSTCDRKGGCQVIMVLLVNPKTFSVKKISISPDKMTYMQANNNIALGAICVQKDQVNNWV